MQLLKNQPSKVTLPSAKVTYPARKGDAFAPESYATSPKATHFPRKVTQNRVFFPVHRQPCQLYETQLDA